jgi:hypothetical protein
VGAGALVGMIGCGQIFLRKCWEVETDRGGRKEGSGTFEKKNGFLSKLNGYFAMCMHLGFWV